MSAISPVMGFGSLSQTMATAASGMRAQTLRLRCRKISPTPTPRPPMLAATRISAR